MKDTLELIQKIRKLEIKTKGLTNQIFSGDYHSAFKGRGMSFSEVREYKYGDEVKTIDWNVTARTGEPHIKIFEEERELTVMLLIDMSASTKFGSGSLSKRDFIVEIAALIAFSALQNNDKVGALLFTSKTEIYISPKKGKKNTLRILREILYCNPENEQTNISEALIHFNNIEKKRSIAFVISDFIDNNYDSCLHICAKKHDIIGLHISDGREVEIPDVGLVKLYDSENKSILLVDTSSQKQVKNILGHFANYKASFEQIFAKNKLDTLYLQTNQDYSTLLHKFFTKRAKR